ncbi:hypothetical protein H4M49_004691, partial [Salmonella enterica subsp. enterica serovar Kentucky]|nr:hypothetical protein [Salmonella enterica subsp. enterica serovar Kentucky]
FDITVILLNQVVQILALPDGDAFIVFMPGIEPGYLAVLAPFLSMVATSGSPL